MPRPFYREAHFNERQRFIQRVRDKFVGNLCSVSSPTMKSRPRQGDRVSEPLSATQSCDVHGQFCRNTATPFQLPTPSFHLSISLSLSVAHSLKLELQTLLRTGNLLESIACIAWLTHTHYISALFMAWVHKDACNPIAPPGTPPGDYFTG